MTFLEHFAELRRRLSRSILVVLLAFLVCYEYHVVIFDFLSRPIQEGLIRHGIYRFRALSVTEPIMVYLKVSLVAAIILGSPYLIYQMWLFISPGLHKRERRLVVPVVFFTTFFFLLGVAFCYTILLPFLTDFLVGIGEETAAVAVDVTLQSALSYALIFLIIFGLVFELPLVLFFMTILGIVTPQKLLRFYRYWLVIAFLLAAIFTPPDPISQLMMAIPLVVLYGVGVLASYVAYGWRKKNEDREEKLVLNRLWSLTGGLMLLGLLALFVNAMIPTGRSHPLRWLDSERPVVLGFQPKVLVRDGMWHSVRSDLVQSIPELNRVLDDEKNVPDLILVSSDLREMPTIIVAGEDIHDRVQNLVVRGMEERREGPASVYGTTSAMRSGVGLLVACVDDRCAFGPANNLMEDLRRYRSGLVGGEAQADLDALRRRGPVWGRVNRSSAPIVEERWGLSLPNGAIAARFWLVPSEGAPFLHIAFDPENTEDMDALHKIVEATTSLGAFSEAVHVEGLKLSPNQALDLLLNDYEFLARVQQKENPRSDLLPERKRYKPIKYRSLFETAGPTPQTSTEAYPWPRGMRQIVGQGMKQTRLWKRGGFVESQWRSKASVRGPGAEKNK
jgi:sec-independent protein translocase protein TatC